MCQKHFSLRSKKKAKGCICCQLCQWDLMKSVKLFSSKWEQNLSRNEFSDTWEFFSLFLLLPAGKMSVFTWFFQFPACTCWFQFSFRVSPGSWEGIWLLFLAEAKMKAKQAHARSVLHQERVLQAGKPWGSSPLASVPLPPVKPQIHTYHGHTETALSPPANLLTSFL